MKSSLETVIHLCFFWKVGTLQYGLPLYLLSFSLQEGGSKMKLVVKKQAIIHNRGNMSAEMGMQCSLKAVDALTGFFI